MPAKPVWLPLLRSLTCVTIITKAICEPPRIRSSSSPLIKSEKSFSIMAGSRQKTSRNVCRNILLIKYLQTLTSAKNNINPLNAELNPIRHLLALVGARHIVHVSRIRVNTIYCLVLGKLKLARWRVGKGRRRRRSEAQDMRLVPILWP